MNNLEDRIKQGRKAVTLARERGMDTSLWEKELARMEALAQAQQVAQRTQELLATRGWCLWQCETLDGDTILVVDDSAEPEELLAEYSVYTLSEIDILFGRDKSPSRNTLRLIQEAKKLARAKVTSRVTNSEGGEICQEN